MKWCDIGARVGEELEKLHAAVVAHRKAKLEKGHAADVVKPSSGCADVNKRAKAFHCVVPVEQKNEEDALGRMCERVARKKAKTIMDSATTEKVPRKKAKTSKDYVED